MLAQASTHLLEPSAHCMRSGLWDSQPHLPMRAPLGWSTMSEDNAELATLSSPESTHPPNLNPHNNLSTVSDVPEVTWTFEITLN